MCAGGPRGRAPGRRSWRGRRRGAPAAGRRPGRTRRRPAVEDRAGRRIGHLQEADVDGDVGRAPRRRGEPRRASPPPRRRSGSRDRRGAARPPGLAHAVVAGRSAPSGGGLRPPARSAPVPGGRPTAPKVTVRTAHSSEVPAQRGDPEAPHEVGRHLDRDRRRAAAGRRSMPSGTTMARPTAMSRSSSVHPRSRSRAGKAGGGAKHHQRQEDQRQVLPLPFGDGGRVADGRRVGRVLEERHDRERAGHEGAGQEGAAEGVGRAGLPSGGAGPGTRCRTARRRRAPPRP